MATQCHIELAIWFGNFQKNIYDEKDWSNLHHPQIDAYTKSKTLAEKEAWSFVEKNPSIKLTCINPVAVWGPGIGDDSGATSLIFFHMIITKALPFFPNMMIPIVDVRDVASMHIAALKTDDSIGKRFLLCENQYWIKDIGRMLQMQGHKTPSLVAPNFIIKIASFFDKSLRSMLPFLGFEYKLLTQRAKEILNFNPIKCEKTLEETARYLLDLKKNKKT